ncbi:MAG: xylulose kinase [Actinobacteria bacterium]|nr:xylulose kinase [Actinomycetota bacterium]
MSDYLAGVDIGTTGAKAAILDLNGRILSSGYVEYKCDFPKPNWVEQDVDMLIDSAMESLKIAISSKDIKPGKIAAVSLSSQRSCTIFLDRKGYPVRPMISWQDNRASREVDEIASRISPDRYYEITGIPNNTTWLLSKIMWLRKNETENWEKTVRVIQLQDYALKAFGADDYYNDIPDAIMSGFLDGRKFDWSIEILNLFNIDKKYLPVLKNSGYQAGHISGYAAEKTGLKKGTPLIIGAGDQNSAAVGAGIIKDGYLSISIGTAANVIAYLNYPYRDPQGKNMITTHAIQGKWQLEGYQAGAASIYRWFRDEIASEEKINAGKLKIDPYKLINDMVKKTPVGSKGLLLLPFFASATAPRWNPYARGVLFGLTFAHDRDCLARSFMEGITLGVKDMIVTMLESGIHINNIRILGGPTKSDLWNQMQADIYGKAVETLMVKDAAILGAAIFAGVGVGLFGNIKEASEAMVNVDKKYEPIEENSKKYNKLYDLYCEIYQIMEQGKIFRRIANLQDEL